ncbi:MAG: bifunctional folylpolyglutamate synthase/dihydrofolate synthase [Spirochaetaceae bacterium]|jgi:dihydrofolate synthase/folylpolyglutamate synthase|nr:bifunctional folylpolyglutamate synthase/dihydrofolate synthase [Spirochaetaceae bacterium]
MPNHKAFTRSEEVFAWLSGFINFERGQSGKSFRLDRMRALAEEAGHPETCAPVIHIAGSKGKGSVTAMASSILEEAGYKTARYTSPHLLDYRERVTLGGDFFPEDLYLAAAGELRDILAKARKHGFFDSGSSIGGEEPTFFELLTLYFFLCARCSECDAMVVETGLGGRLDATNIVNPSVSVISSIELEHTEFLGSTLASIAGEKGGIIKEGRPLVLAPQDEEALAVFRRLCREKKSPLAYLPEAARIGDISISRTGTCFTLNLDGSPYRLELPLVGRIQAQNAALAILAVREAFPGISMDIIARGLTQAALSGRFERVHNDPPLVIDGAHTPQSARLAVESFTGLYGSGGILLFGSVEGKNAAGMAEALLPFFSRIIITTPGDFKASKPDELFKLFRELAGQDRDITLITSTGEAVIRALALGREQKLPILGTGSFYLAAEIKKAMSCGSRLAAMAEGKN